MKSAVYAEFENWNQYWNLTWHDNGMYKEHRRGHWPSFTLIPAAEDQYT